MAARGGPETPQAKAAKYAKVLNKIKKEYLGDCKKVQRISQRIQRYDETFQFTAVHKLLAPGHPLSATFDKNNLLIVCFSESRVRCWTLC